MKQVHEQINHKITKDMTIGELVQKYPSAVEILLDEGVHCVGCGAAYWETIEQGLMGHGKTDEEIEGVVRKLNESISSEAGSNKIIVTNRAVGKLKEILKKNKKEGKSFRIQAAPRGGSGFQYSFSLVDKQSRDDIAIEIDGVKFFVDSESMTMLRGARVDYVESLNMAGLKIS